MMARGESRVVRAHFTPADLVRVQSVQGPTSSRSDLVIGVWERVQGRPGVLAIEVDADEDERGLVTRARRYLPLGFEAVWLLLPRARRVLVVGASGDVAFDVGARIPRHPSAPPTARGGPACV